jgi:hypothetical protein
MKSKLSILVSIVFLIFTLSACNKPETKKLDSVDVLINNEDQLTQIIIYDVFTPPVASRIYVYSSVASYEAIRHSNNSPSIAEKLNGFDKMPLPDSNKKYDYTLAASEAFFKVARNVKVFSVDSLNAYEKSIHDNYKANLDEATYAASIAFGDTIAAVVLKRAKTDGYFISRGKAKY